MFYPFPPSPMFQTRTLYPQKPAPFWVSPWSLLALGIVVFVLANLATL